LKFTDAALVALRGVESQSGLRAGNRQLDPAL